MNLQIRLVNEVKAVLVAQLVKLRRIGIMAGADSVKIVLLHQRHIPADVGYGHRRAHIRVAVVAIHAPETKLSPVQIQHGIPGVNLPKADALPDHLVCRAQNQGVETGLLRIPQLYIFHKKGDGRRGGGNLRGKHRLLPQKLSLAHLLSLTIQKLPGNRLIFPDQSQLNLYPGAGIVLT